MTPKDVEGTAVDTELIDEYGRLDEDEKAISAKKAELRLRLGKSGISSPGTYVGDAYEIEVSERVTVELDPQKTQKALGKRFVEVVKVVKAKAAKLLTTPQMDRLAGETRVDITYKARRRQ